MKVETQNQEDHQVLMTVEVEQDTFDQAKQRAARKIAKRVKIPGFRPGKAPYAVVVRQVGEEAIVEEALELVVQDLYPKALDEAGIEPYGPGELQNVVSLEPPVLEFVVPLEAEVDLGDYHSIRKPYEPEEITDKQVDQVLKDLQDRQAVIEPVERPAEEGDVVYTRLSAVRNQVEEGEEAQLIQERTVPIVIEPEPDRTNEEETDEDYQNEWPYPGFSRNLIGMGPGDEKTLTYTYPEDSVYEALRGTEAEFHFVVEEVKSRTPPELNDEFAASIGEYDTLGDLRHEVQEQLERQSQETYNQMYDEQVLDEAIAQASIKYPPQMLEREIDSLLHNLEHRLEAQNLDLEAYLKNREMDMEALREEARETAETRLKRNLFLYELAQAEQVEVEPEQLQQETVRTMNSLASSLSEKEVKRLSNREIVNNIINTVAADLLVDKATERMRKIASGEVEAQAAQTQSDQVAEPEGMEELEIEMDLGTPPAEEPETIQPEAEMEPEPEVENAPQAEESQEDEEAASEEKEKENEE